MITAVALIELGLVLALTIGVEVLVAVLFGLRGRGLRGVVLVNLATNPALNVVIVGLSGIAARMTARSQAAWLYDGRVYAVGLSVVALLEIGVVLVEWRLLLWALGSLSGSSRRLLALSVVMNLVSALAPLAVFIVTPL